MKVRWLEIYTNISLQLQEFTVSLLQLISYVQLHWTHTNEVEIVIEKSARSKERSYNSSAIKHQVLTTVQKKYPLTSMSQFQMLQYKIYKIIHSLFVMSSVIYIVFCQVLYH